MTFLLLFSLLFFNHFVVADIPNRISISTECKTCPYSLCPNTLIYDSPNPNMNLTCWTEGTEIVGDTTWLKTNDGCFVNQYDIEEYAGDYTTDLPYCGYIEPEWTSANARTRYYSECYLAPYISSRATKYYKYGIELDLTCVAPNITGDRSTILGKTKWYKTTSNCYVHETTLWPVQSEDDLDDCGPIYLYMSPSDHPTPSPTPTPSLFSTAISLPTAPASTPISASSNPNVPRSPKVHRRFLYTTTIGEEYVNCTSASSSTDRAHGIKRVYGFNQTVTPQCGTMDGDEIMLFTTDFRWIKDTDCWEQLQESTLRSDNFPHCEEFVDEVS